MLRQSTQRFDAMLQSVSDDIVGSTPSPIQVSGVRMERLLRDFIPEKQSSVFRHATGSAAFAHLIPYLTALRNYTPTGVFQFRHPL